MKIQISVKVGKLYFRKHLSLLFVGEIQIRNCMIIKPNRSQFF